MNTLTKQAKTIEEEFGKPKNKLKQKKCRLDGCETLFKPFNSMQKTCSIPHAIELSNQLKEKKEKRKNNKEKKEYYLNDKPTQTRLAQKNFNSYIRIRDAGEACISCKRHTGAKMNAGHFLSVGGNPQLRFNEDNCHLQCEKCNSYLSGNIAPYRINLIDKIGLEAVEKLESCQSPIRMVLEDVIEIKEKYRLKAKNYNKVC